MYAEDTIVAPATPLAAGAVAIVRLSGPRAIAITRRIWHPIHAGTLLPRRLYLGEIRDPACATTIDRALCVTMPSPHSLTGEDVTELQCHGGVYLVRRVVALAMAEGARMAEPGEFSRRAFLNGRMDLTEAEAIADLVEARGETALQQALAQMGGALTQRVEGLRARLIAIRAHLEAEIDFAGEDIELPSREAIAGEITSLTDDVALLHDSFARGRLLREGARATIIGKPNAGKSSVMNLLLGADRAIVTPVPGTTRDVIEDSVQLGPFPLVLQDTAGMRESADPVERIGIERTRRHADGADLLIAVFDSSRPFAVEDGEVITMCREARGVALMNKCDLPSSMDAATLRTHGLALPLLDFSATTAHGLAALRDELTRAVESLAAAGGNADGVAISRERHRDALARALDALGAARASALARMPPEIVAVDIALAADALASMAGVVTSEDVLDAVFRQFCIGK